jgi:hypothetical protein
MPGGPSGSAIIGLVTFPAVKFAGYSLAGYVLKGRYGDPGVHSLSFGAARTLLGVVAGISYAICAGSLATSEVAFYLGLIPVRVVEWSLIIWVFFEYGNPDAKWSRRFKYSALGVIWSYILDLYVILPILYIPGWFWIC